MIRRIMRHEWRVLRADPACWLAIGLFSLFFGYGLYNGLTWERFQRRTIAQALAEQHGRLAELRRTLDSIPADAPPAAQLSADLRNPGLVGGSRGTQYAFLPPTALASIAVGQSDLYSYYLKVTTRSLQSLLAVEEIENPSNLLAGRFDLAFAVVYLLPLFVLALSYNLLSAEREEGTLGMVLAQPVSLSRIVAGKIAVRWLLIVGIATVLMAAGLLLARVSLAEDDVSRRLALWLIVVMAYAGIWFGLAVAVNALGHPSATNAMVLAGAWLVLVILVPPLLNLAVQAAHPVPSRVELIGRLRESSNAANARGSQLLARYYQDHPELAPAGDSLDLEDFMTRSYSVQDAVDREMQPILTRYEEQLERQRSLVGRYRFLSPAIVVHDALGDLAGTGAERYRHFRKLVAQYHAAWQSYFLPRIFQKSLLSPADILRFPRYRFTDEPSALVLRRVAEALGILALPLAALWALSFVALRRYRVAG